jgi:hypothetical protein
MKYPARLLMIAASITLFTLSFGTVVPAALAAEPRDDVGAGTGCAPIRIGLSLDDEFAIGGGAYPVIRAPRFTTDALFSGDLFRRTFDSRNAWLPQPPRDLWRLGARAYPRIDWIASSPWDETYRPPLATLRASVVPESAKYGPDRWTAVELERFEPPAPDPEPDPEPEPYYDDGEPLFEWFTSESRDIALIYRVPSASALGFGAYDTKYDNQKEFAIAIKDNKYDAEFIQIAWYTADAIVTYDPSEDFSSGPKVDAPAKISNLRVSYTFFPDEPDMDELQGMMVSVGGGWLEEHISSKKPDTFESPDLFSGIQIQIAVGYMISLGGPALEISVGFDMIMVSENFMHLWFGGSLWF